MPADDLAWAAKQCQIEAKVSTKHVRVGDECSGVMCRNICQSGAAGKVEAEDPGQDGGCGAHQAGGAHAHFHLHLPGLRQAAAPRATLHRCQLLLLRERGGHALPGAPIPPVGQSNSQFDIACSSEEEDLLSPGSLLPSAAAAEGQRHACWQNASHQHSSLTSAEGTC